MNTLNYSTTENKKYGLSDQIVICEQTTLEDIKDQSRFDCIQLFSQALGNFSHYKIFLGSYNEFIDYLNEDCKEDLEGGYIHFNDNMTNLNITTLKSYLNKEGN